MNPVEKGLICKSEMWKNLKNGHREDIKRGSFTLARLLWGYMIEFRKKHFYKQPD